MCHSTSYVRRGSLHAKLASARPTVIDGARPQYAATGITIPLLQTYTGTGAPLRAFHDKGPSLPAKRGNLTIVVGVDKQKLIPTEE